MRQIVLKSKRKRKGVEMNYKGMKVYTDRLIDRQIDKNTDRLIMINR